MQVAARRPHFAAGVALLGASVIAASAVTPMPDIHLPDIQLPAISTANVDLAALANPLEVYAQVFQAALGNAGTLVQNTVPGQLLNQLIANQVSSAATLLNGLGATGGGIAAAASQVPAELTLAVSQLAAGNVEGAVNTLLGIPLAVIAPATGLLPVLQTVLTQPLTNLVNVINTFTKDPLATLLAVSGFIAPLISVPGAAAAAIQNVINAVGTGDLAAVANAVLTAPATIADGLLNGGYGPDLGPLAGIPAGSGIVVKAGGLLSSSAFTFDNGITLNTGGPFYALQQVLKMITGAITPAAPTAPVAATADIASIPVAGATTVTLSTAGSSAITSATAPSSTDTITGKAIQTGLAATSATTPATEASKNPQATTPTDTKGESISTPTGSTTKDGTSDISDGKTTTGTDMTGGNKVSPPETGGADPTKSSDTKGASDPQPAAAEGHSGSAAAADGSVTDSHEHQDADTSAKSKAA